MKIYALVVLYNYDELVLENIKTYQTLVDNVVLLDNSDHPFLHDYFQQPGFHYISMNGNQGIAKALNVGVEYALNAGADWVLTMDQDSKFGNNIISIYQAYIKSHETSKTIILAPEYLFDRKKNKKNESEFKTLKWVMQSANLLNLSLVSSVGVFREDFFIDCVDYEYCLRAKSMGLSIIQCTKAQLIHTPAITKEKKIGFKTMLYGYASKERVYYQVRNAYAMARKYKSFSAYFIIIKKFIKIVFFLEDKKVYFKYFKKAIQDSKKNKFGKIGEF